MSTPIIRDMRAADVVDALAMFAEVVAEDRWLGAQPGFDRDQRHRGWLDGLADPMRRSLVVVDPHTGRVVGNGSTYLARYGVAELAMTLAAEVRGRGWGGHLLDTLLAASVDLGAHKADLQVWPHNEAAIALYLSRGFVVEGRLRQHYRRASGELWDSIVMGRPLRTATAPRGSSHPDAPCLPDAVPISAG
ncbi:MAG: N-acetyltransferase [Candidatus Nanopelagicales bacterium]